MGWDGSDGWDLCAGLFYEHRFAMLINSHLQLTYELHAERQRGKCGEQEGILLPRDLPFPIPIKPVNKTSKFCSLLASRCHELMF